MCRDIDLFPLSSIGLTCVRLARAAVLGRIWVSLCLGNASSPHPTR